MRHSERLSRREFLALGGGTALTALFGGAYLTSGCPLSDTGVCVGPCAAWLDLDGDGECDRVQRAADAVAEKPSGDPVSTPEECLSCPFGLINDPYPGQCGQYVDVNGNGICDLSEPGRVGTEAGEDGSSSGSTVHPRDQDSTTGEEAPQATPTREPGVSAVACPFGLVNDPYPGQCRRYVDANGNGVCDLSEPGEGAPAGPTPSPEPTPSIAELAPQVACPFGLVNDPYPGQCRRYRDANGNHICDLSEPAEPVEEHAEPSPDGDGARQRRRGHGGG